MNRNALYKGRISRILNGLKKRPILYSSFHSNYETFSMDIVQAEKSRQKSYVN